MDVISDRIKYGAIVRVVMSSSMLIDNCVSRKIALLIVKCDRIKLVICSDTQNPLSAVSCNAEIRSKVAELDHIPQVDVTFFASQQATLEHFDCL